MPHLRNLVARVLAIAALALPQHPMAEQLRTMADVFSAGKDGYPAYRIPSVLMTRSGTLLAFAEGRATMHDHAENDIVMKRSLDNGRTWSGLKTIAEDGENALNNPTAVLLKSSGKVILMYQRYTKGYDEVKAEPGLEGPRICRVFETHSDNEGLEWSAPREITAQVKRPTVVTSTAAGPGIGIQLQRGKHKGRILFPFNQGPYGKWSAYAVISDDGGASWRYGQPAPEGGPGNANEVQFAEMSDGSVMLNARNQNGEKLRKTAVSRDGGESWSATQTESQLPEPVCQASILEAAPGVLLFSNPNDQKARRNGTIRLSLDDGKTWQFSRVLYPGGFSYSCLTPLRDGSFGCLFEREGAKTITFTAFTTNWVREPVEPASKP